MELKQDNRKWVFCLLPPATGDVYILIEGSCRYIIHQAFLGSKRQTMNKSMMTESYVNSIWNKRPGMYFHAKMFILLMDSGKSHLDAKVEQGFAGINSSVRIRHRRLTP